MTDQLHIHVKVKTVIKNEMKLRLTQLIIPPSPCREDKA